MGARKLPQHSGLGTLIAVTTAFVVVTRRRELLDQFHAESRAFAFLLLSLALIIVSVVILYVLATAMHEVGHLLVGSILGGKVSRFEIWPFAWSREGGWQRLEPGRAGLTAMSGVEGWNLARHTAFAVGGLFGSAVGIAIALAVWLTVGQKESLVEATCLVFAVFNLHVLGANLIPLGERNPGNDISYILHRKWLNTVLPKIDLVLKESHSVGQRARDWDLALIQELLAEGVKGWVGAYIRLIACWNAWDRNQREEALDHILRAGVSENLSPKTKIQEELRQSICMEQAFNLAMAGRRAEAIRVLSDAEKLPSFEPSPALHRARVAILARGPNPAEASNAAREAREWLASAHPELKPNVQAEYEWLEQALA